MLSTILAFKALTTRNRHDLTRVEMILVDTKQRPLFEVRRFLPQPYPVGSFYDVLERFGGILIRASGTEPVLRVMVEARDAAQARRSAEQLAEAARA